MTPPAPHGQGTAAPAGTAPASAAPPGFGAVLRYFLRLGTSGFGGPIAVIGYMQRDLVEQRGWIAKDIRADLGTDPLAPGLLAIGEGGLDAEPDDQRLLEREVSSVTPSTPGAAANQRWAIPPT